MRYAWDINAVNDPPEGNVGVSVTIRDANMMVVDLLSANQARAVAAHLSEMADKVSPPEKPKRKRPAKVESARGN